MQHRIFYNILLLQINEPQPEEDDDFELPDDFQPFMQDYPLYTDNTANGEMDHASFMFLSD